MNQYIVIRKNENGERVKSFGPFKENKADKVLRSVDLKLDHSKYYADSEPAQNGGAVGNE